MANERRKIRVRVATRGATAVAGNVDFTLYAGDSGQTSTLASLPALQSPRIRPLDGASETLSFELDVVDVSDALTSQLADSGGRMHLVGRLVDVATADSTDGGQSFGSYTVKATGRLTDLSEGSHRGRYRVQIQDERWVERRATVFTTADTTRLYPAGLNYEYGDPRPPRALRCEVIETNGNAVHLEFLGDAPFSEAAADFIEDDREADPDGTRTDGDGNFVHLRANVAGTDRQVLTFAFGQSDRDVIAGLERDPPGVDTIWVWWPSHGKSAGDEIADVYLHAPTAEPTENIPLHVGVKDASHTYGTADGGIDRFALIDTLLGEAGVRHVDASLTALQGTTPRVRERVKKPWKLHELVEALCAPVGVVPFVNADGEVDFESVWLLQDTDPDTLTELDATKVTGALSTFEHTARDVVNVLRATYRLERDITDGETREGSDWPADRMEERDAPELEETHDNTSTLGRRVRTYDLFGIHSRYLAGRMLERQADEVFARWGDGPIAGTFETREDGANVDPGDYVVLNHTSIKGPNPATNDRTGKRVVQTLRKVDHLNARYTFHYLDAGPNNQPLSAPTVAAAQNAGDTKHKVDVTISSLDASADGYVLEVDRGEGQGWEPETSGTSAETVTVEACPAGNTIQVRAKAIRTLGIQSAWASDSVATASLTAPSSHTGTVTNTSVLLTWTNGESAYAVEVLQDSARIAVLDADTTRHTVRGLDAATAYTFEVRHIDDFGGASTTASTSETTGSAATASRPAGLDLRVREQLRLVGKLLVTRVELWLFASDPAFRIQIQRAPDDGTGDPDTANAVTIKTVAGSTRVYPDIRAAADTSWHYRIRHTRDGYADSGWTCWRAADVSDVDEGDVERRAIPASVRATTTDDTLTVQVEDPQCRVTAVEWSSNDGGGWSLSWDSQTEIDADTTEYEKAATLVEGHNVRLHLRTTAYDVDGTSRTTLADPFVFDLDEVANVQAMHPFFAGGGVPSVVLLVDTDTRANGTDASVVLAVTTDGTEPSAPTLATNDATLTLGTGERFGTVTFSGESVAVGGTLRVKARAVNDAGELGPTKEIRTRRGDSTENVRVGLAGPHTLTAQDDHFEADIRLKVFGPSGNTGTLKVWTNPSSTATADPADPADATVASVQTGQTVGYTGSGADHETAALTDVQFALGGGTTIKEIFAQWTTTDGLDSGVQNFLLGALPSGVNPGGTVSPSQNLLGKGAGEEESGAGPTVKTESVSLADARLAVGDVVSVSGDVKTDGAAKRARIVVTFKDSGGSTVSTGTGGFVTGTSYGRSKAEGLTIPATTTDIDVHTADVDNATTVFGRRYMLNRGSEARPFQEPPHRPDREDVDDLEPGTNKSFIDPGYIDGTFRPVTVRRSSGGVDVDVDNIFDVTREDTSDISEVTTREFIDGGYTDGSRRPTKLRRAVGGVDVDADNAMDLTREDTSDITTTTTRGFLNEAYADGSNRPNLLRRATGAVDVDADDVMDLTRENFDDISSGTFLDFQGVLDGGQVAGRTASVVRDAAEVAEEGLRHASSLQIGGRFSLDGTEFFDLGDVLDIGTQDVSFEFWLRTTQATAWVALDKRGSGSAGTAEGWRIGGTGGTLQATLVDDGAGAYATASATDYGLDDGAWHHVHITWNNSAEELKVYVDRVFKQVGSVTGTLAATAISNAQHAVIGAQWDDASTQSNHLTGDVDGLRIWSRVLSATEISARPSTSPSGGVSPAKGGVLTPGTKAQDPDGTERNVGDASQRAVETIEPGGGVISADVETAGDLYIPAANAPTVGTAAVPSSISKRIHFTFADVIPQDSSAAWATSTSGFVHPDVLSTLVRFAASVVLPVGVTITEIGARVYRETTSEGVSMIARKFTGSGSENLTTSAVSSSTSWHSITKSVTETTASGTVYYVEVSLTSSTNNADARLAYVYMDYTMPSYDKTL